jgi:TolB protein
MKIGDHMNKFSTSAFFLTAILLFFTTSVFAQDQQKEGSGSKIYIKMGDAQTKKSIIALPPLQFVGAASSATNFQSVGGELYKVIENDLTISTFFQFLKPSAFLEDVTKTGIRPFPGEANGFKFDAWKQAGAEFLVRGAFSISGNEISLEIYAYDVAHAETKLSKKYRGPKNGARRIAHTFCNDLLEELTGKKGPFLSKVVVSSDKDGGNSPSGKMKEIYVMDWDGTEPDKITNHKSIALSPSWSPDGSKVAYTAFVQRSKTKTRNADLFVYDIFTGKKNIVSYRQGMNSGSNFSPDGKYIYLTLSQNATPDIFKITVDGEMASKITNGPHGAMNIEPAISPDGRRIAFSSDRSGQPMIWIADADGTGARRITFAGHYNSTPAWSPDGKKIVFAGWESDHFDVFVMNTDGSGMTRITQARKPNGKAAMNEDPVFSPDGRLLMYTSNRTGNYQIYISNLDGTEEHRITQDSHNYFKPKWSVNIQ